MIRKIERYIVDGQEFSCLRDARNQAEENLASLLRPLIYNGAYNPSNCINRLMDSMLKNRKKYIKLLNDLDYEEDV